MTKYMSKGVIRALNSTQLPHKTEYQLKMEAGAINPQNYCQAMPTH